MFFQKNNYGLYLLKQILIEDINHLLIKKCEDAKEIYQKLILNRYKIIANLFIYRYSNPKRKI